MKVLIRDFMTGKGKLETIASIEAAKDLVVTTIDKYSISISEWNKLKKVGEIYEDNGECIARVTYGGAVWTKEMNSTTWVIKKN